MNYIRHLSAVFEQMDTDTRLTPYHISLYMTLFRRWNLNFFRNPISVSRDELMRLSKIGSVNTYTKCLKELDYFGFIKYEPSYNPHRGSLIYLYSFDKGSDKGTDYGSEIALRPYTNNLNSLNSENKTNLDEPSKKMETGLNDLEMKRKLSPPLANEIPTDVGKKLRQKKKIAAGYGPDIPPLEEHVQIYFDEKGYPFVEAEKFFNYFQSNGWLVGGRTKMKDWKAAARNWMLNAQKFNAYPKDQRNNQLSPKPGKLHSRTDKDYGEPL
ncbi:MAG: transcriptional regulator [Flammeovirgaceae bacterium]|nr:transcriptional regulator [Flammeovirgaceae bacterium]MBE63028.1 transcriptional regulator [Flammeovirgaceae bacterium]MBR07676.1 transcriptional regulator [Rickettsiales bacterium]